MRSLRPWLTSLAFCVAFASLATIAHPHGGAGHDHRIALLIIDADSFLVNAAIEALKLPEGFEVECFTHDELETRRASQRFVAESDVVIIDVMGSELVKWLLGHLDPEVKRVYALRGSRDDASLRRKGIVFAESVKAYFDHLSTANIRNLIRRVIHEEIDPAISFAPVEEQPEIGIYHPDADRIFDSADAFRQWYDRRPETDPSRSWVGVMFFSANLIDGQRAPYDTLIRRLEQEGFNVMPCFGRDREVIETLLLDENRRSRVNLVLAFSLKFYSAVDDDLRRALADLDIPVLDAINLYTDTIDDWRRDAVGIQPQEIVWTIAVPEMSAVGEPTPLSGKVPLSDAASGKTVYTYQPIEENVDRIVQRVNGWLQLQATPNAEKRVALLYYNHNQGKQNIGASYLNVFRSLECLLGRLEREGYTVGAGLGMSADDIRAAILRSGRNIGAWAPGELERMLAKGEAVHLPLSTYAAWFAELPQPFRRAES